MALSISCGSSIIEIGISKSLPFGKVLTLTASYHAIIGIGEAILTIIIIQAVRAKLPEVGGVPA